MSDEFMSDAALTDNSGFPDSLAPAVVEEASVAGEPTPAPETAPEPDTNVNDEGAKEESPEQKDEKRRKASERIRQLTEERNRERSEKQELLDRIARLESARTPEPTPQAPSQGAPNPADYPYGSLDENYIQDTITFRAQETIQSHMSALQRQQQEAQLAQAQQRQVQSMQEKANDIVVKGIDTHPDFFEVVMEGGLNGTYALEQPTFEAITEAENSAEIAYELASNPAEAAKVARMTPIQQARYVFNKDAEINNKKNSGRFPKAPTPPSNSPRGSSGRFTVSGDTEDLDAFEKEFFKK